MIYRTTLALASALLVAVPAGAQVTAAWDTDGSSGISRDEWHSGMQASGTFGAWDANGDAMVDNEEFAGGLFDRFDRDQDGYLNRSEWNEGFGRWQTVDADEIGYQNWDVSGDGTLDRVEFVNGYRDSGLYDRFRDTVGAGTTNAGMNETEFYDGTYGWMDRNQDDDLAADENQFMDN